MVEAIGSYSVKAYQLFYFKTWHIFHKLTFFVCFEVMNIVIKT